MNRVGQPRNPVHEPRQTPGVPPWLSGMPPRIAAKPRWLPGKLRWVLVLACLAVPAAAGEAPSVLVTTMAPRQGAVPDTVEAFGTAAQRASDTVTLSVPHQGQVWHLAVAVGQSVRAGALLLQVVASPAVTQAYRQAVSALALANSQRAHTAQLLAQRLATRVQLEQADKAAADAQAALDALRREGADQAVRTLAAPFAGVVTSLSAAQGAWVPANAALLTLARGDRMAVTVGIEPADRPRLRPGQPVRLEPLADGSAALAGTVEEVGAMVDPRTHLVAAVIGVRNGAALVGADYRAVITVGQFRGWIVPRDAVLSDASGTCVFQVTGGKAVRVGVRLVGTHGQTSVVQGPIMPDRPLVTQGNYQLADGMAVRSGGSRP
ncbi:MAG TPA: efflux RND transporter periplasmic adaptor subunit [Acetobacteraceae bacterium]|nr:efflux RND transporter periplasmic adaptor subunit [Acetobacteraceae bacterium]